jgi:hypothetical protein
MSRNVPLLSEVCLPCDEEECDNCHNLLWAAGCQCPHTSWPEPRCGTLGRDRNPGRTSRRFVCDLPALPTHEFHEGRYWYDPDPDESAAYWWGWAPRPQRWTWRRVIPAEGRFDPYDPTAPSNADRSVA